jgi:predicted HTH transcriptional regulator
MSDYIKKLIAGGESQVLDFKFEISDYRKIARTLVSFSNTGGGRLLVGVKDNGAIAGVRSEEEYFMVEGASRLFCRPEVKFSVKEWLVEGRKVLEVIIGPGEMRPYMAQDQEGNWTAYIRQGDQNFKADKVQLIVWAREKSRLQTTLFIRDAERQLFKYLERGKSITISKFRRMAGLSSIKAETIFADFMKIGLLKARYTGESVQFSFAEDYQQIIKDIEDKGR